MYGVKWALYLRRMVIGWTPRSNFPTNNQTFQLKVPRRPQIHFPYMIEDPGTTQLDTRHGTMGI